MDSKRCAAKTYVVGHYVMIRNVDVTPGVNKKHIPKYKGPYKIEATLSNDRYVRDIQGF